MINKTGNEASETSTRVGAGDVLSENDDEDNIQSHFRLAASQTHYSKFDSTLFKSADRIESKSFAKVEENSEWGIHGIIGKEVIDNEIYYCVDWEPTMVPLSELCRAKLLVWEFEAKRQSQLKRAGNIRKNKH
jgi:hypothetical protein